MILDYGYYSNKDDRYKELGEKQFFLQFEKGFEGYDVVIDEENQRKVIIQNHTNLIQNREEDKKLHYLNIDNDVVHWGSIIDGYSDDKYIVITESNKENNIYSTCKIRKLTNDATFQINDEEYSFKCILSNTKLYEDQSYINDGNVFEEDDRRACVLPYNQTTSQLKIFDYFTVDDETYKIIKIDNCTLRRYNQDFGIIQLILIRTVFGEIYKNFNYSINGLVRFTRMKERVYNSNARELITDHNIVRTGDYITHEYARDKDGNKESRTYIVRSMVDMKNDYDTTFMLNCQYECKLLDSQGNIHRFPLCYSDNRDRAKPTENPSMVFDLTSYECYVQNNTITANRLSIGNRILIWDDLSQKYYPLEVKAIAPFSMKGLITINFQNSQIIDGEDNLELGIADYKKQMAEINKNNPPTQIPTDVIIGSDEIYIDSDYSENPYILTNEVVEPYTNTWSISALDGVDLMVHDKTKCFIRVANKTAIANKFVVLKATLNGIEYTKQIKILGW